MNKSVLIVSELITKIMPFLFIPYLTNKLGAQGMGVLALFQMYWAFFLPILNTGFDSCLNRYFVKYGNHGYQTLLLMTCLFIVLVFLFLTTFLVVFNFDSLYFLALLTATFNAMFIVLISVYHIRGMYFKYAFFQSFNSAFLIILNLIIFEFYEASVDGRIISLIAAFFITCIMLAVHSKRFISFSIISLKRIKLFFLFIISFCFPLILNGYANFIRAYVDRFFIDKYYSVEELGIYSLTFQLTGAVIILVTALNKAFVPIIYKEIKQGSFLLLPEKKINLLVFLSISTTVVFSSLIPNDFYTYIFGGEFEEMSNYVFPMLTYAILHIYYFYYSNYLFYVGKTKLVMYATMSSLIVQIPYVVVVSPNSLIMLSYSPLISLAFCILTLFFLTKLHITKETLKGKRLI
ncbi:oligosaccharide flippase family protein [Vibrio vulnificus]|nr:oligosaccharide flippase family protein [Vibrio vulnificus]